MQHSCIPNGYHNPVCNLCNVPAYQLGTILLFATCAMFLHTTWVPYYWLWLCNISYNSRSSPPPFLHLLYLWHLPLIVEAVNSHSSLKQSSVVQTFAILSISVPHGTHVATPKPMSARCNSRLVGGLVGAQVDRAGNSRLVDGLVGAQVDRADKGRGDCDDMATL